MPRRCYVEVTCVAFDHHCAMLDEKTNKQVLDDVCPNDACRLMRKQENHTSLWSEEGAQMNWAGVGVSTHLSIVSHDQRRSLKSM